MKLIRIHPADNVAVALEDIAAGEALEGFPGLTAAEDVHRGHKLALTPIGKGQSVVKYGRAAVRNELWIVPTVGCVNAVAKQLVERNQHLVTGSIDGLYTFPHPFGCSQLGDDHAQIADVLAVAGGEKTKAEQHGAREISIFKDGVVL